MTPITYPARPVNGGSFDKARPKIGVWHYEPKNNGWRALVHAPSGGLVQSGTPNRLNHPSPKFLAPA